ncbi:PREDICTED: uncharacterized protein LOC109163403 [Ipomoea nil]|uniref:uncharacterized protein LOC109163403 n=1 Tax=Ipomoea nil TaxID=35883 RepID=UPI000900FCB2|nr:PREDICTED: uncharacterized protein LOC109163403 [Ipomoea nil]
MRINIEDNVELIGRVIVDATMGSTHYLLHIARERDWEYFIRQTLPNGELHVYVQIEDIYSGGFGVNDVDPPEELPSSSTMVESSSESDDTYQPNESIPSESSGSTEDEDIQEKTWYARHKCIEMQYGNYQHSYNELPQFCRQLQLSNPGTIVEIMCTLNVERGTGYANFLYAFWAFKPAIDGFCYYIPVICVDGTHLYNQYKGHLLLACGYTANKEIYPLAYSIVDSENNASWTWFLRLLAEHVFPHHNSMCIISDRHAGIDAAFNSVQQLKGGCVKCRFCLRHIRSNVMTRVTRNRRLRKLVWEVGTAVTRNQFLQHMQAIQIKWPAAYAYLADIDVDKWTLSHDDGNRCTAGDGMQQHGLLFTTKITDDLSARNNEACGASIQSFNDALGIYGVALSTGYVSQSQQNHFQVNLTERTCNCGL